MGADSGLKEGRVCCLLYWEADSLCGYQISGLCSSMDGVKWWVEENMSPVTLSFSTAF